MNNRRKIIVALGMGALAAPFRSFAQQQGKVWRVGVLSARSRPDSIDADAYGAFRRGMRELGYIEGKNLAITWLFADGKFERAIPVSAWTSPMEPYLAVDDRDNLFATVPAASAVLVAARAAASARVERVPA